MASDKEILIVGDDGNVYSVTEDDLCDFKLDDDDPIVEKVRPYIEKKSPVRPLDCLVIVEGVGRILLDLNRVEDAEEDDDCD